MTSRTLKALFGKKIQLGYNSLIPKVNVDLPNIDYYNLSYSNSKLPNNSKKPVLQGKKSTSIKSKKIIPNFSGQGILSNWRNAGQFESELSNLTDNERNVLSRLGLDTSSAINLLKSINNYLKNTNFGQIAEDNKWGNLSATALRTILNIEAPQVVSLPFEQAKLIGSSTTTNPASVNFEQPVYNFNRSQTRQLIRNSGINPYNYSGSQRKALRKYFNGEISSADKSLNGIDLTKFNNIRLTIYKKGGQLVSRNPTERFLLKKNLIIYKNINK